MAISASSIAPAKINLVLDVLYKRTDGYHELDGIMHSISIYDKINISITRGKGLNFECDKPVPADNTAVRAASLYMQRAGISKGLRIVLEKHIPSQAGMGGASADAAAVLMTMQELFGALSAEELISVAAHIGADVPFCLRFGSGCARARGIGERLDAMPTQSLNLVVVKPERGVSTPELFSAYDALPKRFRAVEMDEVIDALEKKDAEALSALLYNALEPAAAKNVPEIFTAKKMLMEAGATGAVMTGSGSAVFGIFSGHDEAVDVARILRYENPEWYVRDCATI